MTIALPRRARILVVALRRLGDVLLTTPLIRSLKRAYPDAAIDALVFAGTQGILAGNPDLAAVITMPPRPAMGETLVLLRRLWRRYDLAVSTQSGDRPTFFAWAAGRRRIGLAEEGGFVARLKQRALGQSGRHRARQHRSRAAPAGRRARHRTAEVVAARRAGARRYPSRPALRRHPCGPDVSLQALDRGGLARARRGARARGLAVIATGGPADADKQYLDGVWTGQPAVRRLDGALSWAELAALIGGAAVYVGPTRR